MLVDDIEGLPPTLLVTCGADPLRDEGVGYGRRLERAGVALDHRHYAGMIHAFLQMDGRIGVASELMEAIASFLRAARREGRRGW
ncbi:alpha/beta hydrolase [Aureimonas populi]|nr:alpha/beta hydrolase [Aureimonas populi]